MQNCADGGQICRSGTMMACSGAAATFARGFLALFSSVIPPPPARDWLMDLWIPFLLEDGSSFLRFVDPPGAGCPVSIRFVEVGMGIEGIWLVVRKWDGYMGFSGYGMGEKV